MYDDQCKMLDCVAPKRIWINGMRAKSSDIFYPA